MRNWSEPQAIHRGVRFPTRGVLAGTIRAEQVLWLLALLCAVLLLFAPLTPRTMWIHQRQTNPGVAATITAGHGWDGLAWITGIIAIVALVVGACSRPHVARSVISGAMATLAFAASAIAATTYWLDLSGGAADLKHYVTIPAPGPLVFAAIATVATILTVVLTISWRRSANSDW